MYMYYAMIPFTINMKIKFVHIAFTLQDEQSCDGV
jgi:hypothetical protein